jgi:hypothetical protein
MYAWRTSLASDRAPRVISRALSPGTLQWMLRVGAFLCFVGHGAFGIMTKRAWLPYFAVAGIGPDTAYRLMPLIGALDISMGMLVLFTPRPAVIYWMFAWAVWTALLRPLAGESVWEAVERAGNYGVPAALLCLVATPANARDLVLPARFLSLSPDTLDRTRMVLSVVVALLLVGHGALGLEGKPGLVANYATVLPPATAAVATPVDGVVEIAMGIAVLGWPSISLALFIALWKVATESLFLVAGQPVWEFVERGGSYTAPLGLAVVIWLRRRALS